MLGKPLGRKRLADGATIASPETILRWYRELVAKEVVRECPAIGSL
jgi:hypothetical protein